MYLCEQCGKEVHEVYGSGRFCSRSCSNKWVSLHQSSGAKARKVSIGVNNLKYKRSVIDMTNEERINRSKAAKSIWTPEHKKKISSSLKGRIVPEETKYKLSVIGKRNYETGRSGFKPSHFIPSNAEKLVISLLDGLGVSYEREVAVSKSSIGVYTGSYYSLDFLIGNIDLEIDGSYHETRDQRIKDSERDKALINAGYKVVRLKYTGDLKELESKVLDFLRGIGVTVA